MRSECLKNFDALFAVSDPLGDYPSLQSAGTKAMYTTYMHPYKSGERLSFRAEVPTGHIRGMGVAGDYGYILVTETGEAYVHPAYMACELYCEEGFLDLFVCSLLTGLPLVTLIELLDLSVRADYAAVVTYRDLSPKIRAGIEALIDWDHPTD